MAESKAKKERLSIWLCREKLDDASILKTAEAKAPIELAVPGGMARLYVKRDRLPTVPSWTGLFLSRPEVDEHTFKPTRTIGALLLVEQAGRTFALTFGTGFHLLHGEGVERDFGMRVALNAIEPDKLRSVDKASYDHNPLNSRTQSTTEVDIFDLHMNTDTDMLYAVTGMCNEPLLGSRVTGRDALTLMIEGDLDKIPEILAKAMELHEAALPVAFEWFDNVRKVRDPDIVSALDLLLDDELSHLERATAWLGEPEVVDWEVQHGYAFDRKGRAPAHAVLSLSELATYMQIHHIDMTVGALKDATIHVVDGEFRPLKQWNAYRCLYAELPDGKDRYILRNATWYVVSQDFASRIDASLSQVLQPYGYTFPEYTHQLEKDYNDAVVRVDGDVVLMDRRTIRIGGPYDKIEFCDLLRNGTDLIHVKHYRNSTTLSHLFSQGHVSAEAFAGDAEFRRRLNDKLPAAHRLSDPTARPDTARYSVVYAIATTKKLPSELPFFSKVTLRNACHTLGAMGFNVKIAAIPIGSGLLAFKTCKPNGPKGIAH